MKNIGHVDLPPLVTRADVVPESLDRESRTFEVIFSTGAPVTRTDFWTGDSWIETLGLASKQVRLDRLNNGAPFLNAHSAYRMGDILGVVVGGTAKIREGRGTAKIRMSAREDVAPIWRDIADGIIRNVSVGYRVHKYEQSEEAGVKKRHAIDWEPYEVSAVPMGADPNAQVRAEGQAQTNPCAIVTRGVEGERMDKQPIVTLDQREQPEPNPPQPDPNDPGRPQPQPAPSASQPPVQRQPSESDRAVQDERERTQGILRGCEQARLEHSFALKLIADGVPLLKAREMILETLSRASNTLAPEAAGRPSVEMTGGDPHANVWRGMENALLHKVAPQFFKLEEIGYQYRGQSLLGLADMCLRVRGYRTTGLSKLELAGAALGLDDRFTSRFHTRVGYHTTSDFPNILADVANKTLRRAYEEAPATWLPISRRVSVPDFKPSKRLQIGEAPPLLEVKEHGEFQRGTIAEGKEEFTLATYGRIFAITRKALVNDDTDAFSRLTMLFGRSARTLESDLVWAQITANAAMGDGTALFHANHGNLVTGPGTAITVDSLGVMRAKMRTQKGLDGTTYLNITPRYLLVPPGKETLADQFTTQITPAQATNVNPFTGRLVVIAEPRLETASATAWYMAATPDQIDVIEYAYLDGEDGPMIDTRIGFDIDGMEIKCRHDFAAKAIDWRGLAKNDGV